MSAPQSWTLVNIEEKSSHPPRRIKTEAGDVSIRWEKLVGGRSEGVQMLRVDTGPMEVMLLPTRGMGIWKITSDGVDVGWNSPTRGPVHPAFVPIFDPSGKGWLEGFDELLVRCGLLSNGAPEFAPNGQLTHPLHGRIANLPAEQVELTVDEDNGEITIESIVYEARFLIYELRLKSVVRLQAGSRTVRIDDSVINASAGPSSMQLLYHINIGSPILQGGSRVHLATDHVIPRNAHAAASIQSWNVYQDPTIGFQEQVYFTQPKSDRSGWTTALLTDADATTGVSIRSHVKTLPYFILWKNTAAETDGYVTGLEPATGFPNPRSFEEKHQRVVNLAPGEERLFQLEIEIATDGNRCQSIIETIDALGGNRPELSLHPRADWCAP